MSRQIFKSTALVSSLTLFSRLMGFVRDALIARLFGVDMATDAFFVAFKIPNLLRRLFTEGAFSHALIPMIAGFAQTSDRVVLKQFIDRTAGNLIAWALLLTLAGTLLAPVLVFVLAPGFAGQGPRFDLAVELLRISLPYGLCMAVVAFAGAVLNAHHRYFIPALTPVFLNICMIAAALWLAPLLQPSISALAWGVIAAGAIQVLIQIPSLWRLGLLPRLTFTRKDPDVTRLNQLLLPSIFSASITQINLLLDSLVASFLGSGSVSWLYYSDRLVEFPLGILGIGLSSVILPNLVSNHVASDPKAFSATLDWGLRLLLLIGMPATVGLFMLAEPLLSTLFQYDEFTLHDVHKAGMSLKAYTVGLLGYLFIKILVPAYTSRLDVKTPVRFGVYAMIVSLGLNVVLVFPLAHAGLALATSLGAFVNAAMLLIKLLKDDIYQPGNGWRRYLLCVTFASAIMAGCLQYFVNPGWWEQWDATARAVHLLKWVVLGCLIYAASLWLAGLRLRHLLIADGKIKG